MRKPTWIDGDKPFDMADCGMCLTMHAFYHGCSNPEHKVIEKAIIKAMGRKHKLVSYSDWAMANVSVCRRLRRRFTRFFLKTTKKETK